MALIRDKQSIGLDLGPSSAKLVQLAQRGKTVEVVRQAVFDARREGLLDEAEMFAGTASWLKEMGLAERDVGIGLPQYLATTQVSDFPPNAAGDELREMVNYETVQLAGLSDEAFASDYHVMAPEYGRKSPVLIGTCRQTAVDERNAAFAEAGLRVCDVAMEGLAAANALFFLHPEVVTDKAPQVVMDIGAETSTLLVVAAGQVLFVGSLLFGASKFDKVLARFAESSAAAGSVPNDRTVAAQLEAALQEVNRQLESEIRNSLEHWRAGERPEISQASIGSFWLCGGGAKLEGLDRALGRSYGCSVTVFGPATEDGQPEPQLAVALGLALQSLGQATIPISLCPAPIQWAHLRKKRFGYLLTAAVILVALTVFYLVSRARQLERRSQELSGEVANLDRCRVLIPKLEENSQLIQHHEKMLLPIVEKGNRAGRFLKSIDVLAAAQGENGWFIYLADELSFEEGKPKADEAKTAPAPERPGSALAFPGTISSLDAREAAQAQISAVLVTGMEQVRGMIMAGLSPKVGSNYLEPVKAIQARLNESTLFKGADVLPKPERVGREEEIFQPWINTSSEGGYLQRLAKLRLVGPYVPYMFRLPFAALDVNKLSSPPPRPAPKPPKPAPPPAAETDRLDDL